MKERYRTSWTAPAIAAATSLLMILFTVSSDAQAAKDNNIGQGVDVGEQLNTLKDHKKFFLTYDKFKDYTTVGCKPVNLLSGMESAIIGAAQGLGRRTQPRNTQVVVPDEFALSVAFGFAGSKMKGQPHYALIFLSDAQAWELPKDRMLYALIDGQRLEFGEGEREGSVYVPVMGGNEQLMFSLTREQIEEFANGKSVEIKLGRLPERKLKSDVLERFRGILYLTVPMRDMPKK